MTTVSPLPTPPSRANAATFSADADAFLGALPTFGTQLNAVAGEVSQARADALAAAASVLNAPGTQATSTSSRSIGIGSKAFAIQTGKAFVVGQFVLVASTASPAAYMHGQITAHDDVAGSLTVDVTLVSGSGTHAAWTITLSAPAQVMPAGAVVGFLGGTSAPAGWLKANGALVSRTAYAALWAYAQASGNLHTEAEWAGGRWGGFSVGDGTTTFRLPDMRGEFLRGWDDSRGVDAGRALGVAQAGQNALHSHSGTTDAGGAHGHPVLADNSGSGPNGQVSSLNGGDYGVGGTARSRDYLSTNGGGAALVGAADPHQHAFTTGASGGAEARPRNVPALMCIKF